MDSASGVLEMRAQYDPSFSHYFDMEPSFNPAAVGKQSKLKVRIRQEARSRMSGMSLSSRGGDDMRTEIVRVKFTLR